MRRLQVRLRIPDRRPQDAGSTVRIALRDTTLADTEHPTIAEASGTLAPGGDWVELSVDVPDEQLDPRHRYSVWAHVDRDGSGEIRGGDLITTQDVAVRPDDLDAAPVEVPLARI